MEPFRNIDEGDIENREASNIEGLHGPNPRVAHRNTACTYWRDKTLSTEVEHCLSLHTRRGLGGDRPEDINGFAVLGVLLYNINPRLTQQKEITIRRTSTAEHVVMRRLTSPVEWNAHVRTFFR